MSAEFVPLFQAFSRSQQASRADDARTRTAAAPSQFVATIHDGASPPAPGQSHKAGKCAATGTPDITLEKDGERITHIRIRCTCGQVTEIECAY